MTKLTENTLVKSMADGYKDGIAYKDDKFLIQWHEDDLADLYYTLKEFKQVNLIFFKIKYERLLQFSNKFESILDEMNCLKKQKRQKPVILFGEEEITLAA